MIILAHHKHKNYNMSKQKHIVQEGEVLEALANGRFRVKLDMGHENSSPFIWEDENELYSYFTWRQSQSRVESL